MASDISNLSIDSERKDEVVDDSFVSAESGGNEPIDTDNFITTIQEGVSKYIEQIRQIRGQQQKTVADRDNAVKFAPLEKSLNEVQVSLRNLKQNIEIPEVTLEHHPEIKRIVEKAHAEQRRPAASDLGDLCQDSEFLNSLQNYSIAWINEFKKVTQMDRDPAIGTTLQEVTFWVNLEKTLNNINELRETEEVAVTMEALKLGKRFHATVTFESNTGLKEALAKATDYNQLMKDFPIKELLTSTDLETTRVALQNILLALKKLRTTKYPVKRAVSLISTISSDLCQHLIQILRPRRLMHVPFGDLEIINNCNKIFQLWDIENDKIQQNLRELIKKQKTEMKTALRGPLVHKQLETRLLELQKYRKQHDEISTIINRMLRHTGHGPASIDNILKATYNPEQQIAQAYDSLKEIDYLDITKEGQQKWDSAWQYYNEQISNVETQLASRLRDQLGGAKNADEMFSIFSRYNSLFIRIHIRSAIREYQTTLIARVKLDIDELQKMFSDPKNTALAQDVANSIDIPDFSAKVMWIKQIESQLLANMRRVEDVLGGGWANHLEGKELKKECDLFRQKLDTSLMFKEWTEKTLNKCGRQQSNKLFNIERQQKEGRLIYRISVNYSMDIIVIAKEVRNLKNMGFRIPFKIMSLSHQANATYPYAISLLESMKLYESTNEVVLNRTGVLKLVAEHRKHLHELITEGYHLAWDNYKIETYVTKMADTVSNYDEKVTELIKCLDKIDIEMDAIDTCQFDKSVISQILTTIQETVNKLILNNYSNISEWVENLDQTLEKKLARRVEDAIRVWTATLNQTREDADDERENQNINPEIHKIPLEIRIMSQIITVVPSVEEVRNLLLNQLYSWHGIVTLLPRISFTRLQQTLQQDGQLSTYKDVLVKMPHKNQILLDVHSAIENVMRKLNNYTTHWTRYQALWDLQPEILYERLGNDLTKWIKVLTEIKRSRASIDLPESHHVIFPFNIDFGKVQSKVSLKYEYWQREVLVKFGAFLGSSMQNFFTDISKWRSELESQTVDSSNTSDTVQLITYVQQLKKHVKTGQEQVEQFTTAQKILTLQRYTFPSSWLYAEHVEGEWSALMDVLNRKDAAIQSQVANLQSRILEEDRLLEKQINEALSEWSKSKPISGKQKPSDAIIILSGFDERFKRLKDEQLNIEKAKHALEVGDALSNIGQQITSRLEAAYEELLELIGIWKGILPIHESFGSLREMPWLSVQPRKLRQNLEELMSSLKQLPSHFRNYESYDNTKRLLNNYSKMNILIIELKSEAVKDRHWRQLMRELHVNWNLSELTLGHIWDADLIRQEVVIRDVLATAQGELAIENYISTVREYWTNYIVDLVSYQQKTKLIRGWDDLFNKLKEHMNNLTQMKFSPYYKQFEEDALAWEERLNQINALFDVWIDVQRRWVYLEGLFTGSADIVHLLPTETSRFTNVSTEFLGLMKKVTAAPRILDVVHIQGAQRILERLADNLAKVQKALGEYLERERSSFPRFYFVGDEDLLEILGNSKDIMRVQKHLKKMFAGIMAIEFDDETRIVSAMISREGEHVQFKQPIDIKETPKVNDWLRRIEQEMQSTLAKLLGDALITLNKFDINTVNESDFMRWLDDYPTQIVGICSDIWWTTQVEKCLEKKKSVDQVLSIVENFLSLLSDSVLNDQSLIRRRKIESLITEFVHKRDICRQLVARKIVNNLDFEWDKVMRMYFDARETPLKCCLIKMANAEFTYGFEYLGIQEKLVQTPLTDRCYLTMTQALHCRLGGSPFGPAGTGKTESVKALGNQLGRFVLVFNCDETFDFQAIGRILVGLCQVGAWGCFDEFNRLEERMLSAVSQQIQTIQESVRAGGEMRVDLVGKTLVVNANMAIFITMNPGYTGRSNLPDNLKQLFRSLAMTQPDRKLIAEVMLFSQGFQSAETLARKIVPLFTLCKEQLSDQYHYDFGLRALKYVLVSAGNIKRNQIHRAFNDAREKGEEVKQKDIAQRFPEHQILIQSICETLTPKLVSEDMTLLQSLLNDVFPDTSYAPMRHNELKEKIGEVCSEAGLSYSDAPGEKGNLWLEKVLQLYQITNLNHGLMLVGASGSGKTTAWKTLLKALEKLEKIECVSYVVDAKAMNKEALYGVLDANTREWTDGLFTHIIRKIIDNVRGEADKRQWIIFDGDVDPEWVENLNSVLDDNKLLTLPNGERLSIPSNVRIIFEVADLKYATLATVSRCGMIWFSEDIVTTDMLFDNYQHRLQTRPLMSDMQRQRAIEIQKQCAQFLQMHMVSDGLVSLSLEYALTQLNHVMDVTRQRLLLAFFSMTDYSIKQVLEHDYNRPDFPISPDQLENYVLRSMLLNLVWAFSGDGNWKARKALGDFVRKSTTLQLPPNSSLPIIDYYVQIDNGEWALWSAKVPQIEIEAHRIAAPDTVIPTMDTVRHELLLNTWLSERKPLVLCGPPGSGKTMTLLAALRSLPDMDVINVNFSSSTTPELLMKSFEQYCEYRRTPNGTILCPTQLTRWLVVFCDEINLPMPDKYGTQRVISFIRQLVEQNGFYRTNDKAWITLERIQFVGACNPPTDPGRHPLSARFLRHVPIVYVDYPGKTSLIQIYHTFSRAMIRAQSTIRAMAEPLTEAMVDLYLQSQERFTQDEQPHYIYSPRELTRWIRGISEVIASMESADIGDLVRLWAHEALRLFNDRLVHEEERKWTEDLVDSIAIKYFSASCDIQTVLKRPMLYSCWLSRNYVPVLQSELEEYVQARLKGFYEEELDVRLVLFDQMLDHVLRIDRIYRQPQGHLLLIGVSGSGKTTLSRFVAWLNGLSVYQLKVHSNYTAADFDEDIRQVLKRAGCKNEKICFILDESNMLNTGFLERLNTLLANGEVPGLFEGDDYNTLLTQIKDGAQRQGLMLDTSEELYRWFTQQIIRNLHVVFTMNPSGDDLRERASTSPALFNRCVVNWFGDWSAKALYQVGEELTGMVEIEKQNYAPPGAFEPVCDLLPRETKYRHAVINTFVQIHNSVRRVIETEIRKGHRTIALTPRHFLDFIKHYTKLHREKQQNLEEEKIHLNNGLRKIRETEEQVKELKQSLTQKGAELERKQEAANSKLQQMLADQQEAENEKKQSEQLQRHIAEEKTKIDIKKSEVEQELSYVLPAVEDAKNAVSGITKKQLAELKTMSAPPNAVKLTAESMCLLLGENVGTDWRAIRSVLVKEDFITRITNFNTEYISPEIQNSMRKYEGNPDWEFEKVNRASTACGPLVKWAKAQLSYARMLNKVEPLNSELGRLEADALSKEQKQDELMHKIADLEDRIKKLKDEYAELISESGEIKKELDLVQQKVNRSTQLLSSLRDECNRWEFRSEGFSQQMDTLVGDVLLSAAFLTYSGYFDQHLRDVLFRKWIELLNSAHIVFRSDLARIEYLSTADERMQWQNQGMSKDDLCMENVIMLHRFNRYPLIIDPSGQSLDYLCNQYASEKKQNLIIKTSFLDNSFRKNLESALRFGSTLLVQDVESYDPILNPVLNREVKRTGGRVLITIGDQDIDLSPAFRIFLFTRDSSVEFPADVCSRVTFVNFTVTRGSLEMQCLNQVLRSERPDIDKKRNDQLKLQGEFAAKLRQLEKSLLLALNDSKGKILDDDSVIATLENLKTEAKEVKRKSEETDQIIKEVEVVSQKYIRLAHACSLIYLMLHHLDEVHFLYNYSLEFLMDMFTSSLNSPQLTGVKEYDARLSTILQSLFSVAYARVSQGMLHTDKVLLALLLLRIYLHCGANEPSTYDKEFEHLLLHSSEAQNRDLRATKEQSSMKISKLSDAQNSALILLAELSDFDTCIAALKAINANELEGWITSDKPELNVPSSLYKSSDQITPIKKALNDLLLIHALRPDRVVASTHLLVTAAFGSEFMQQDKVLNLREIIENEVKSNAPVLLCSAIGYDVSGRVEDLALELNREVTSIAIGSAEGFNEAEAVLSSANKHGRWVLLKNVHLAPSWLSQLEKRLHNLRPHAQFRLILTAEINPKLPTSIIQASRVLIFEPSTGLKANLLRSLSAIPPNRITRPPAERSRLYFLFSWFHAIVQERLRYQPLGWANTYEFTDADLRMAFDTLDAALDKLAMDRANLKPDKLPWNAFRTLLSQCIYGGKIDNQFDQKLLDVIIERLFQAKLFDPDFVLIPNIDGRSNSLLVPEETSSKDGLMDWVHQIKAAQMPNWIGLPNNAEKVLLTVRGRELLRKMLKVSDIKLSYDGDETLEEGKKAPSWMLLLSGHCQAWLKDLPQELTRLRRTRENIKDPLFRFFEREINLGAQLLTDVRRDLTEILTICKGEQKQSNHHRALITALSKSAIPASWVRYTLPNNTTLTIHDWMHDFIERVEQFKRLTVSDNLRSEEVWLGGMFFPEAYITATRQLIAQSNGWSLEQLHIQILSVGEDANVKGTIPRGGSYFTLKGFRTIGAVCKSPNNIHLTDEVYSDTGRIQFTWTLERESTGGQTVNVPVYLYANRARLLFRFEFVPDFGRSLLNERGVALICNIFLS